MLSFHVGSIPSAGRPDLTIASQTHPTTHASQFLPVRLNFDRSCRLLSAECIVSLFGNLRFYVGSESAHEASQKMLLLLEAVLSNREGNKDCRGGGTQLL